MNKLILLQSLAARLALHHPATAARCEAFIEDAKSSLSEENQKKILALQKRAAQGDNEAFSDLQAMRVIAVENYLTIKSNSATFFETVELKDDEEAMLQNESRQEIMARFIGQDGKPRMTQIIRSQNLERIPLKFLSTDEVEVPLIDIDRGHVAEKAMSNIDLAAELALKEGAEMWNLIKACVGPFNLSGAIAKRVYVAHSAINAANLPTTNLITLANNTGASKFRFDAIKAMVQWCMQWGNNVIGVGEVTPISIFIPSKDVGSFLDDITPTMNDNAVVREIQGSGYVLSLAGKSFNIIPDAQLDPAAGMAYVRTNIPLGKRFTKPGLAQSWPTSLSNISREERQNNRIVMSMKHPYGAVCPNPQRMGVIGIKYRN